MIVRSKGIDFRLDSKVAVKIEIDNADLIELLKTGTIGSATKVVRHHFSGEGAGKGEGVGIREFIITMGSNPEEQEEDPTEEFVGDLV